MGECRPRSRWAPTPPSHLPLSVGSAYYELWLCSALGTHVVGTHVVAAALMPRRKGDHWAEGAEEALTTGMQLPMVCVPGWHPLLWLWWSPMGAVPGRVLCPAVQVQGCPQKSAHSPRAAVPVRASLSAPPAAQGRGCGRQITAHRSPPCPSSPCARAWRKQAAPGLPGKAASGWHKPGAAREGSNQLLAEHLELITSLIYWHQGCPLRLHRAQTSAAPGVPAVPRLGCGMGAAGEGTPRGSTAWARLLQGKESCSPSSGCPGERPPGPASSPCGVGAGSQPPWAAACWQLVPAGGSHAW